MNEMLENLWYSYQEAKQTQKSKEERKILNILIENEEKLRTSLTEEQREWLKNYEYCMDERNCISEKNAFIDGVRFATRFWAEAFYNEETY